MEKKINFQAVLEAFTEYYVILDPHAPNFNILAISEALLKKNNLESDSVVGKGVWELYTIHPDANLENPHSILGKVLNKVIQKKLTDKIESYNLNLAYPSAFIKECSWMITNSPVLDEEGKILYLLQSFSEIPEEIPSWEENFGQKNEKANALFADRIGQGYSKNYILELANAMPQLVWIANPKGEVKFCNDRLSQFANVKRFPNGKWNCENILHPEDLSATIEAWTTAIKKAAVFEIEHRIRMEDNTYHWHLSRALPQRNELGAIEKWYGTATNIHAHKLNEEALYRSEEQLRLALEAADLGIFYFYPQSQELFWSQKTKELIGVHPDEDADVAKYWESIHPDDREKNALLIEEALRPEKGGVFENEFRIVRFGDNNVRWMRSKGKVSFDEKGNPLRLLGVTQDLTERKKVEEEMAFKNAQLSRINKELDSFVYTASHDLKAPINHVEGLIQVLMMELPDDIVSKGEVPFITTKIQQAIERFKKNIANLAEVVKLRNEEGGETGPVNVEEIVKEVLTDIDPMIRESGVQVEVNLKPLSKVLFSEKNLRSVIYNLLSNAIKYRSTRREPRVQISSKRRGAYLVLIIEDNGTGIEKENMSQLFTMFKRFHPHIEGTGVGLFMVKSMVENSGGFIEVESQAGQGTTFSVNLLLGGSKG